MVPCLENESFNSGHSTRSPGLTSSFLVWRIATAADAGGTAIAALTPCSPIDSEGRTCAVSAKQISRLTTYEFHVRVCGEGPLDSPSLSADAAGVAPTTVHPTSLAAHFRLTTSTTRPDNIPLIFQLATRDSDEPR
jgi:hypothetical protein